MGLRALGRIFADVAVGWSGLWDGGVKRLLEEGGGYISPGSEMRPQCGGHLKSVGTEITGWCLAG